MNEVERDMIGIGQELIERTMRESIIDIQKKWNRGYYFYKEVENAVWEMLEPFETMFNDDFRSYMIELFTNNILNCKYTEWYKK